MIGGGVLATAAIGAIVATAVISTNKHNGDNAGKNARELPAPTDLPDETAEPEPSFSSVAPPPRRTRRTTSPTRRRTGRRSPSTRSSPARS